MEKWERRDRKLENRRNMRVSGRGLKVDYPNAIRKKAQEADDAQRRRRAWSADEQT